MQLVTKRLGLLEIEDNQILTFPEGLLGFSDYKRFVVVQLEKGNDVIRWLQSIDDPSLGFLILDPRVVFPDYDPEFSAEDLDSLDIKTPDDLVMVCVVTVPRNVRKMTANLQAPLLINPEKRLGKQVITISPEYSTRHEIFPALENLLKRTG